MKPTHFYDFDKNLSKRVGFTKIRITVWKSAIRYLYGREHTALRKLRNHSVEKREILSHWKKISSSHLFSIFYSKTNAFTKFLRQICVAVNFSFFHILWWILPFFRQIDVFTKEEVTKELISPKFFSVIVVLKFGVVFSLGRKSIPDFIYPSRTENVSFWRLLFYKTRTLESIWYF